MGAIGRAQPNAEALGYCHVPLRGNKLVLSSKRKS
jgi:hypothetical protein